MQQPENFENQNEIIYNNPNISSLNNINQIQNNNNNLYNIQEENESQLNQNGRRYNFQNLNINNNLNIENNTNNNINANSLNNNYSNYQNDNNFATEISKALEINTMAKALGSIKDCLSILLAFLVCYGILIISTTTIIITMGAR